jgi:hypothetical protein
MEFEFLPAILAGLAGGIVMTTAMVMMRKAGKTEMDMALMQGAMFTGDRSRAKVLGAFSHLVMFSALILGTVYAALFAAFDVSSDNAWWIGALLGVPHGILAGIMMGMMPKMHPRMAEEDTPIGVGGSQDGALLLKPPGLFAKNYGSATPVGMLMAHVLYGLIVGLVYSLLV